MAARPSSQSEAAALSLTVAVVTASPGPLLLLDGAFRVVAASASFAQAFDVDPAAGQDLAALGPGWAAPELRSLLEATASGAARIQSFELDLVRPGRPTRALVIHAQRLAYLDLDNQRLLVAVNDVTDARADAEAKADALRQNFILLQEVRHRVANSLQIIASVLLQQAKKTASGEARGQLKDAHNRVMSIGALERQLSVSRTGNVELRTYFTQLCASIGASMIGNRDLVFLVVTGAGGMVDARVSVALGLIVTELVINALKYAFPDGRAGQITVDCAFVETSNWAVTVSDDGVGMPADPAAIRFDLGTSIVEALAQQLDAVVITSRGRPGTRVSITHNAAILGDRGEDRAGPPAVHRSAA